VALRRGAAVRDPDIHVPTPQLGNTQRISTNHATTMPSIMIFLQASNSGTFSKDSSAGRAKKTNFASDNLPVAFWLVDS